MSNNISNSNNNNNNENDAHSTLINENNDNVTLDNNPNNGTVFIDIEDFINDEPPTPPPLDATIHIEGNKTSIQDSKNITISFFDKSVTIDSNNKNERSVINLSSYVLSEIER